MCKCVSQEQQRFHAYKCIYMDYSSVNTHFVVDIRQFLLFGSNTHISAIPTKLTRNPALTANSGITQQDNFKFRNHML